MKLQENLFDLTPEQEKTSRMIYDGKIIKCLVAPYHTYQQLEQIIPYTKNTYLFPEREASISQIKQLISLIVASNTTEEIRIITANQNIIMDMIDDCVRVYTEGGDVVPSPCKTFMANIHDIRHYLLENEKHQLSTAEKNIGHQRIMSIFNEIEKAESLTKEEYDKIKEKIDTIGEPLISQRLLEIAHTKVAKNNRSARLKFLEEELARLDAEEKSGK